MLAKLDSLGQPDGPLLDPGQDFMLPISDASANADVWRTSFFQAHVFQRPVGQVEQMSQLLCGEKAAFVLHDEFSFSAISLSQSTSDGISKIPSKVNRQYEKNTIRYFG
jgi:hypothetical protein